MPSERRLHPASILFALLAQAKNFLLPGILVLFTAQRSAWGWETWAMLGFVPVALASTFNYLFFRYRYDADEMVIRSGFVFRNERHVPYARIQNVDAVQGLLHRLLGVAEVRLETGAGTEPEAVLRVLPLQAYEEMRRRVFGESRSQAPGLDAPAASPGSSERVVLRLDARELALYGIIENRGIVVVGAFFGVLWELGLLDRVSDAVFGESLSARGVIRDLIKAALGLGSFPAAKIALSLAALAAFLVAMRLLSMAWAALRLHGFTLSVGGDELRTRFGLLTRVSAAIPLRRVQTVTVRRGPLHRLFERASVRVDTAGGGSVEGPSETQREWLAPLLPASALPALLREVVPEVEIEKADWQPAAAGAFHREFKGSLIVAALICLGLAKMLGFWVLLLFAMLVPWAWLHARLFVRHLGHAVTDGAVVFRSGWLWRQLTVARFAKIQAVAQRESPFDRRAQMASIQVDTAGASDASHRVHIPYLELERARALFQLVSERAARTAFRW